LGYPWPRGPGDQLLAVPCWRPRAARQPGVVPRTLVGGRWVSLTSTTEPHPLARSGERSPGREASGASDRREHRDADLPEGWPEDTAAPYEDL